MEYGKAAKRKKLNKDSVYGYIFISPPIIGFILFGFIPLCFSLVLVFTEFDFFSPMRFVGLYNLRRVFDDPLFFKSIANSFINLIGVPLQILVAFCVALLLNINIKGQSIYKTLFFIPSLCSSVAISLIWKWFYNKDFGVLNSILNLFGIGALNWLGDKNLVMFSMILQSVWLGMGTGMVMYIAALKGVPKSLYEAADIAGASRLQKIWYITLPMVSPTTFYLLVMGGLGSFQDFARFQLMTNGGPDNASLMPVLYIYQAAFRYPELGYSFAATISWLLAILIVLFMGLNFIFAKKWVHYSE